MIVHIQYPGRGHDGVLLVPRPMIGPWRYRQIVEQPVTDVTCLILLTRNVQLVIFSFD